MQVKQALEELRQMVPAEQVESIYVGESGNGGAWTVEPAATVELVDLLKWANRRHALVYTRRPRRHDEVKAGGRPRLYLRSRRMRRIIDLDVVSGLVTVEAGITMAELHQALEERGAHTGFPTRPWRQEPLGAILAASLDAHWGPQYGAKESEVLGLGVAFPNGELAHTKVSPKRAVGPDFDRLFLGSRGRFGIIYEATLKIYLESSRTVRSYAAKDLVSALEALNLAFEWGLSPRAAEILTPASDRDWGKRRVGLSEQEPVLLLIEPRFSNAVARNAWEVLDERLSRLSPPVGWNVHEGLLPPPRSWTAPVVPVSMKELFELAKSLGPKVPSGLWLVRMGRHGGHLSMVDDGLESGESAQKVAQFIAQHQDERQKAAMQWAPYLDRLVGRFDPKGILNRGS